ncbi:molybdopterin molybdotransferase MoeA [Pricia sp. S334]|uniref:Molybdopterin molybdenumtransferase n=1 Tax=Pricia mediterranea TaxID=3076079 RepID=A0ABU3L9W6_9FLAO|nr:molybdopterin molybdotransferase MoeA [Pricia sp. S334]MDT7829989.1 molybdopterin molybdotransferase MoeA [Pricia sp. S334]
MISFEDAFQHVLLHPLHLGDEQVDLLRAPGRILAENITADRDFPPFDRSTKDGIAIRFSAIDKGIDRFKIEGTLSAGMAQQRLISESNCFEIMTGAVLPEGADTIIMYEDTDIENGWATLTKTPDQGQNIHAQGSDETAGAVLLRRGLKINAAAIGVLASVGKTEVVVKKLPSICVISTGNELVEVSETPLPHQIRKSNILSLTAALQRLNIVPARLHLTDDRKIIEMELREAFEQHDVLLLSGGVSKGKFDFIPDVLADLGVEKIFHRVAQRPGKPFWFGVLDSNGVSQKQGLRKRETEIKDGSGQSGTKTSGKTANMQAEKKDIKERGTRPERKTTVFSFPGNPVSTFANYHVYFLPWLSLSLGLESEKLEVIMEKPVRPHPRLTLFLQVETQWREGRIRAKPIQGNGSGDLVSLAKADGFIRVPPGETELPPESSFWFVPCT